MVANFGLPYRVEVGPGKLGILSDIFRSVTPGHRAVIITDDNVGPHYAETLSRALGGAATVPVITIPHGEQTKTRETWASLTDTLLADGFGRDTTIVALGGGVIGDLAGFVAATYMRGVPFIQVPTTLLAMVDASIGGKTGVDAGAGKNLVGAFHQPAAVVIDTRTLRTLDLKHIRAGFAEIFKHGIIADAKYLEMAIAAARSVVQNGGRVDELTDVIRRSIEIKAGIVAKDEREAGVRKILNFGHTIGHAMEALDNFVMPHGEAVAIGMVVEARVAERMGVALPGTAEAIEHAVSSASLPMLMTVEAPEDLIGFTRMDKKARGGQVQYALPRRIGEMAGADSGWSIPVPDDVVREVLMA